MEVKKNKRSEIINNNKTFNNSNLYLFGLSQSRELTKKIAKYLNVPIQPMKTLYFSDEEILVKPVVSVRGKDVFLVQSTCAPVNDSLMELLIAIDALKNSSARSITVITPYFGYARQDRKTRRREPITSKLVGKLIQEAGANRIITVDIHSTPTLNYFNIPSDNISMYYLFAECIVDIVYKYHSKSKISIVSPDYGGSIRVRELALVISNFNVDVAIMDKRRPKPNQSEILNVLGGVEGRVCFIVDDIIDTGGTICKAAEALINKGAEAVYVLTTHGVLSGRGCANLEKAVENGFIKRVILTDTIEMAKEKVFPGLEIITIAKVMADVIKTLNEQKSISLIYDNLIARIKLKIQKNIH